MPPCWRQMASEKENCIVYGLSPEWVEKHHWKLFIRTIGKTTNETRSLLCSAPLAVYFSTYKSCEKKWDVAFAAFGYFILIGRWCMPVQTTSHFCTKDWSAYLFTERTREIHNLNSTIHHVPGAVSIVFRMNAPCHFCFWPNARWVHMAHLSVLFLAVDNFFYFMCSHRWIFNAVLLSTRRKNSPDVYWLAALLTLRKKDEITSRQFWCRKTRRRLPMQKFILRHVQR
jgi:hypothetical protein